MKDELEDIPIEPEEANDLGLHVRNCLKRHTALVKLIRRDKVYDWIYRTILIVPVLYVAGKLATIPPEGLAALGLGQ